MHRSKRGFTLVELLITVAIAAILLTVGVPMMEGFARDSRLSSTTNNFVAALNYARSEAVGRAAPVAVCPSADQSTCTGGTDWSVGWIAFVDDATSPPDGSRSTSSPTERLLRVGDAAEAMSVDTSSATAVIFDDDGTLVNGSTVVFDVAPNNCSDTKRRIDVIASGRPRAQEVSC